MRKIILILIIAFTSCKSETELTTYVISMQKVNGEWITKEYVLPTNIRLFIYGYKGSYSLEYTTLNYEFLNPAPKEIRAGIIDFKLISKEKL